MQDVLEQIETGSERISTGIIGATEADDMIISQKALEMISTVREHNNVPDDFFLRIATRGGGCSGMSYALGFDNELSEGDRKLMTDKLNLVVDAKSLFYLMGVTLDFVDGPSGSGFIFTNPNDMPTCGCHG